MSHDIDIAVRCEGTLTVNQPSADIESDLIDLTELALEVLPSYDERLLTPVLSRLLRRIDDPDSITSGFNPQRFD